MSCDEVDELAGALALGAALPEEVAAVDEHTAGCARCRAALQPYVATAELLAGAVEPVEPPPGLRERILAAARTDAAGASPSAPGLATPAAVTPAPAETGRPASLRPRPVPPAAEPAPAPAPRPVHPAVETAGRPPRWRPAWLAAAAALLLAVGLGGWNVKLQRDLSARDDRLAAQDRAITSLAQGGRLVALNVQSPDLGAARGSVLLPAQGPAVMAVAGLARPAEGRVYELWAIHQGQPPVALSTFVPGEDGRAVMTLPDIAGALAVAVTVERGRVEQPSGPPVLLAPLA